MCVRRVCKRCGTRSVKRRSGPGAAVSRRSWQTSTRCCAAGLATSNTRGVDNFGQSYGDGTSVRARGVRCKTINAGPMPSSQHRGCSPFMQPMCRRVNPDEATTDWRAVCGRTACTVRRAGRARALSDPYPALGAMRGRKQIHSAYRSSALHGGPTCVHMSTYGNYDA